MVKLEKELRVEEVRLYGDGSQIIATGGSYDSEINLGKDTEEEFGIVPNRDLIGRNLTVTLESRRYKISEKRRVVSDNVGANTVLLGEVKETKTRHWLYNILSSPETKEETEYIATFYTRAQGGTLVLLPQTRYELKMRITKGEYRDLLKLPPATVMELSLRV